MKFISITLENFRLFNKEKLSFSTDSKKNVSIIIGNNGSGKTTLAQAFQWCLYGISNFKESVLSHSELDRLKTEGKGEAQTKVIVELEHFGNNYQFVRTATFKVSPSGIVQEIDSPNSFICYQTNKTGGVIPFNDYDAESRRDDTLPKKLAPFVFFDGERIETMSDDFKNSTQSKEAKAAVEILLGIDALKHAAYHLNGSGSQGYQSLARYYAKKRADILDGEGKELSSRKIVVDDLISCRIDERKDLEKKIADYEEQIKKCSNIIRESQVTRSLQKDRDRLLEENRNLESIISGLSSDIKNKFAESLAGIAGKSIFKYAIEIIREVDLPKEDVPGVTSETIDYLIKHGKCICGTQILKDQTAYYNLVSLKERVPPQCLGASINDFFKTVRQFYSEDYTPLYEDVQDKIARIDEEEEKIKKNEDELRRIKNSIINGEDIGDLIKQTERHRSEVDQLKGKANQRIGELNSEISRLSSELNSLNARLADVKTNDAVANAYHLYERYSIELARMFNEEFNKVEQNVRFNLMSEMKRIFGSLIRFKTDLSPEFTSDYRFQCVRDNGDVIELSTAESFISVLSFIAAIINVGRQMIKEDSKEEAVVEPVPLVMDAPLSAFDKDKISNFGHEIPQIAEQLILFIKDTDGDIVYEQMKERIGKSVKIINTDSSHSHCEIEY